MDKGFEKLVEVLDANIKQMQSLRSQLNTCEPETCKTLNSLCIGWMRTEDGIKCMPYIENQDGEKIRVNNCPSCGVYVRDYGLNNENP